MQHGKAQRQREKEKEKATAAATATQRFPLCVLVHSVKRVDRERETHTHAHSRLEQSIFRLVNLQGIITLAHTHTLTTERERERYIEHQLQASINIIETAIKMSVREEKIHICADRKRGR